MVFAPCTDQVYRKSLAQPTSLSVCLSSDSLSVGMSVCLHVCMSACLYVYLCQTLVSTELKAKGN